MKLVSPDGSHTIDTDSEDVDQGRVLTAQALGYATKEQHDASAKLAEEARKAHADDADAPTPKTKGSKA